MKWVLPLVRHLVLEERVTSPLMQSKAICNPDHCTFFFFNFMKDIGHRGTFVSPGDMINHPAVGERRKEPDTMLKGELKNTLKKKKKMMHPILMLTSCLFAMYFPWKLNVCLAFFLSPRLPSLSSVTFQRVDGGLMSNGRWVRSVFRCSVTSKLNQTRSAITISLFCAQHTVPHPFFLPPHTVMHQVHSNNTFLISCAAKRAIDWLIDNHYLFVRLPCKGACKYTFLPHLRSCIDRWTHKSPQRN